jgi:hypothetical protein
MPNEPSVQYDKLAQPEKYTVADADGDGRINRLEACKLPVGDLGWLLYSAYNNRSVEHRNDALKLFGTLPQGRIDAILAGTKEQYFRELRMNHGESSPMSELTLKMFTDFVSALPVSQREALYRKYADDDFKPKRPRND